MRPEWFALYVKSRHEFVARRELEKKGTETYLPTARRLRRWKDRRKLVEFPLFPGYLFVHIAQNPEEMLGVLRTKGAVGFVGLGPGGPTPIQPEEMRSLMILVESGEELDIYPELKEGQRVRVSRGPLAGSEGVLLKKGNTQAFLVNIEILGRSVGVNINASDIEAG